MERGAKLVGPSARADEVGGLRSGTNIFFSRRAFSYRDVFVKSLLADQEMMVVLAEAVGFVADVLEEFESGVGAGEF
jgi:hypothetical protein